MGTRKFLPLCALGLIAAGMLAPPASAHGGGWHEGHEGGGWHGGWGFGVGIAPFYAAPPYYSYPHYYYPPPVYYAPPAYYPPAYYPPPAGYYSPSPGYITREPSAGVLGQSCNAGPYVCPTRAPIGTRCSCPGNEGRRVYGSVE